MRYRRRLHHKPCGDCGQHAKANALWSLLRCVAVAFAAALRGGLCGGLCGGVCGGVCWLFELVVWVGCECAVCVPCVV